MNLTLKAIETSRMYIVQINFFSDKIKQWIICRSFSLHDYLAFTKPGKKIMSFQRCWLVRVWRDWIEYYSVGLLDMGINQVAKYMVCSSQSPDDRKERETNDYPKQTIKKRHAFKFRII